jgi:hypothetical protein
MVSAPLSVNSFSLAIHQPCFRVTDNIKPISNSDSYNRARQVFHPEHWDELMKVMREKRARGEALVHTFENLEVLPNERCGVVGNYRVNITFLFNGRSTNYTGVDWKSLEPSAWSWMGKYLNPMSLFSPHHLGPDFPIIPTEILYYSEELVNELAKSILTTSTTQNVPTNTTQLAWA